MTQKIYIDVGSDITYFPIGYKGESGAREVIFDVSEFKREFSNGQASLRVLWPGEKEPRATTTTTSGNEVHWIVSANDTAAEGEGKAELFWSTSGTGIVKTKVWGVIVEDGMISSPLNQNEV